MFLNVQIYAAEETHVYCSTVENCLSYAKRCLDDVETTQYAPTQKTNDFNALELDSALEFMKQAEKLIGNSEQSIIAVYRIRYFFLNNSDRDRYTKVIDLFNKLQVKQTDPKYVEINYYAGRSYFELSQFDKARHFLGIYINSQANYGTIETKKEALKLFLAYYYFSNSFVKSGLNTNFQYEQITKNFDEWIRKIDLDISDMVKKYNQWKKNLKKLTNFFDLRLKYFYKHHSNIHLLPDDLPFSVSETTDLYNEKTDQENAILLTASYMRRKNRFHWGLKGLFFENFYVDNKQYDFRGSSGAAVLKYRLSNSFDLNTDYTFSKSCQDSKKYQQEHRFDFMATQKIEAMKFFPESHLSFFLERNYIDNLQMNKLDGIQTDYGSQIVMKPDNNVLDYLNVNSCQLMFAFRNENRSVDIISDQSFSGYKFSFMSIFLFPYNLYVIKSPGIYGMMSYRKRNYDLHDHFFEEEREEKKKVYKIGVNWHWHLPFINRMSSSFCYRNTRNDSSIKSYTYKNKEWIFSLEWKPF
jgi:hypothetical protein